VIILGSEFSHFERAVPGCEGSADHPDSMNVLSFVEKILKGTLTTRNYSDLSPWTAMPAAYPWSTNIPPKK
jgi:hypothetical protein